MAMQNAGPQPPTCYYAYAFERLGFNLPLDPLLRLGDLGDVRFLGLADPLDLDKCDGLIVPQGVFETFKDRGGHREVHYDEALLLERERQVRNLLKAGKWVCFLVQEILDSEWDTRGFNSVQINFNDTDLCKRLLNTFLILREPIPPIMNLSTLTDEFRAYVTSFGGAKTAFDVRSADAEIRVLIEAGSHDVGFEAGNAAFFLPFHSAKRDDGTLSAIVKTLVCSVTDYRRKRMVEVPKWAERFEFDEEKRLRQDISRLIEEISRLDAKLETIQQHKAILTTSGENLKERVVSLLHGFFGLKIDPIDEGREDAKILGPSDSVLALVEAKGTNKGIKREHVNQVDSHRERNGLDSSTPGVLIINNEMSIEDLEGRLATKVPEEQIRHACIMNVVIVRTIDLLYLARHFETSAKRGEELMALIMKPGWIRAGPDGYEIVTTP